MAKLDDIFTKKKETAPVLDLSKTSATVSSQEEFRRMLEKVPDFKMRAEKVPPESIKLRDKFKINTIKHDKKAMHEEYAFMNPIPVEMKNLDLDDLASVSIDWRMLTTQRPKTKLEEDFFTRLVELARLRNKSRVQEKRQFEQDPMIRKTKNKAGIVETRVVCCTECGEDFCNGKVCSVVGYDAFARVEVPITAQKVTSPTSTGAVPKKKTRSRSTTKSSRRKKSKSPKKPKSKSPKRNKSKSPRGRGKSPKKSKPKSKSSEKTKKSPKRTQSESPRKSKKTSSARPKSLSPRRNAKAKNKNK